MKKFSSKGKVHPSPPPSSVDHRLSFLPATILTLIVALSVEDREVLAYIISCSGTSTDFAGHQNNRSGSSSGGDHAPQFDCNCFRCYMSYWVKWDTSPNRQIIHQILDEYEGGLLNKKKKLKVKKERRNRVPNLTGDDTKRDTDNSGELESVGVSGKDDVEVVNGKDEMGFEKGTVRKLVSFIGERFWGVWDV